MHTGIFTAAVTLVLTFAQYFGLEIVGGVSVGVIVVTMLPFVRWTCFPSTSASALVNNLFMAVRSGDGCGWCCCITRELWLLRWCLCAGV